MDRPWERAGPTPGHLQGGRPEWVGSQQLVLLQGQNLFLIRGNCSVWPQGSQAWPQGRAGASWGEGQAPPARMPCQPAAPPPPPPANAGEQDLAWVSLKARHPGAFTLVQFLWSQELDRALPPPTSHIRTLRQVGYEAQSVRCKVPLL